MPKHTSRRFLLILCLFVGFMLILGCGIAYFMKDKSAASVSIESSLLKDKKLDWPVTGQAAVGSVEDGLLARSSENEKARPIASMAKIIMALALMEKQPFEPGQAGHTYTFTVEDIKNLNAQISENGSVLPVLVGMELTQYQIMQRLLLASDNNMADKLAREVFGSEQAYVSYANSMVKRMGLHQTTIADPSGLDSSTVSTPSEMVMIGIAALKNPIIAEIVAQKQAELPKIGTITNTNELLGYDGVIGIKTGTTNEAGSCLLFASRAESKNGQETTIVGVVMGAKDSASRFDDSKALIVSVQQNLGLIGVDFSNDYGGPQKSERQPDMGR